MRVENTSTVNARAFETAIAWAVAQWGREIYESAYDATNSAANEADENTALDQMGISKRLTKKGRAREVHVDYPLSGRFV